MTPTQDELSLAEAVGRLTEENKNLQIQVANLGTNQSTARAKAFGIAFPLATAVALLGSWLIYKGITASGQVEHCYIDYIPSTFGAPIYRLNGHVAWGEDPTLGDFTSIEAAKAQAAKLDCKMGPLQ